MTVEAQVRAATTPGEALLILARAIDDLQETPAENPWTIPDGPAVERRRLTPLGETSAAQDHARRRAEIERQWDESEARGRYNVALRELGDRPGDPEDAAAWDAQRALLADILRPPTGDIGTHKTSYSVLDLGRDNFEVTVPTASAQQQQDRLAFIKQIGLDQDRWWTKPECALELEAGIDGYMKGGPIWLHAYDRDFVMQLPVAARAAMVADVEATAPDDAHDLARDILKDTTPDGAKNSTLQGQAVALGMDPGEVNDL